MRKTYTIPFLLLLFPACEGFEERKKEREELRKAQFESEVEPKVQIARMFDSVTLFVKEEHISLGFPGMSNEGPAPHFCPGTTKGNLEIDSGVVPPLDVKCSNGPGHMCVPTTSPRAPWEYDFSMWLDNPVFQSIGYTQEMPHIMHYQFVGKSSSGGYGSCEFTIRAFGDVDGDGTYSTYERSGKFTEKGMSGGSLKSYNERE